MASLVMETSTGWKGSLVGEHEPMLKVLVEVVGEMATAIPELVVDPIALYLFIAQRTVCTEGWAWEQPGPGGDGGWG